MIRRPPRSPRTALHFRYTTRFRSLPSRTGRLDRLRPPSGQVPDAAAQAAVGRRAGAIALHNSGFPISMKKAVILVSGGMDSAVVLAIAREQGFAVHALSVSYGQRHTSELDAAVRVARDLGATDHTTVNVYLGTNAGSAPKNRT